MIKFFHIGSYTYIFTNDEDVLSEIEEELTYSDSKSHFIRGKAKDKLKIYFFDNKFNRFPIGLFEYKIEKYLKKEGYKYTIHQKSKKIYNLKFPQHLEDFQKESLRIFFEEQYGIIKVATGGGKSVIGDAAIDVVVNQLNSPCIFLVDSTDILKNAKTTFKEFSGLEPVIWGNGNPISYTDEKLVVAGVRTIQSLLKEPKKDKRKSGETWSEYRQRHAKSLQDHKQKVADFKKYIKRFRLLVVDEIQEFGSKSRSDIVHMFGKSEFKMFLSATPFKKGDHEGKKRVLGFAKNIIHEVTEQQLVDKGKLAKRIAIIIKYTEEENNWEKLLDDMKLENARRYDMLYKWYIIRNERRNRVVSWLMNAMRMHGLISLTLVQSNVHGRNLANMTGYPFVCGEDDGTYRNKILKGQRDGTITASIASNIYSKGVNIPCLDVLINAGAGKESTKWEQKRGRVLRNEVRDVQSKSVSIDFFDATGDYFEKHSEERLRTTLRLMPREQVFTIEFSGDFVKLGMELDEILYEWYGDKIKPF